MIKIARAVKGGGGCYMMPLFLAWQDADGQPHTWALPERLLVTQPGELEAALMDRGLHIDINADRRAMLRNALAGVQSGGRVTLVHTPGWCAPAGGSSAFVFIDGTSHRAGLRLDDRPQSPARECFGEDGNSRNAGGMAARNCREGERQSRRGIPVCAAFDGPLIEPLGEASGGFHFHGRSKAGKTLAARMGVSVRGAPKKSGLLKDWRATANALEGAAEECNDGLLTLDEIHQAEPRDVVGAIYQLANESGKGRLNREAVPGAAALGKPW